MSYNLPNYDTWKCVPEDEPEEDEYYDDMLIDYQIDKLEDRKYDDYNR